MQVLLRDTITSLYYAGGKTFTTDPSDAVDFRNIGCASEFALRRKLFSMEIILKYSEPLCQITLPLRPVCAITPSHPPPPKTGCPTPARKAPGGKGGGKLHIHNPLAGISKRARCRARPA